MTAWLSPRNRHDGRDSLFLNLTVHSDKPVVLVGSMRPSTAISADGPANLYNGVATVADAASKGHGVLCCMNNQLPMPRMSSRATPPTAPHSRGGTFGSIGYVYNGKPYYYRQVTAKNTINSVFDVDNLTELPKVGIVYGYANCSPLPMEAFVNAKFDGIVLAGVGDGNFYKDVFDDSCQSSEQRYPDCSFITCPHRSYLSER